MAEPVDVTESRPLRVAGEAAGPVNPFVSLVERLVVREAPVVLDLHDLTVTDEFAVTQCVNAMRELLVRGARVVLLETPEHLAKGLAHAGLLLPPSGLSLQTREKSTVS